MAPRLRTPKEVAEQIGLSVDQVRALIHQRKICHVMIGKRPMIA
jgi:excisionase family DNA binding protein